MAVQCAAKVLGVGDPKATYDRFDTQTWRDKLKEELRASSPSGAIQSLTKEMLESAQINALLSESGTIIKQLREMSNVQKYVLFLYSPSLFDLVPVDVSSLRQGEPRKITTLQKKATNNDGSKFVPFWILGIAKSIRRSMRIASCSKRHR